MQEKRLKYLEGVASAVILQNTFDMSLAIQALSAEKYSIEKYSISRKALATLCPHIKTFEALRRCVVDLQKIP